MKLRIGFVSNSSTASFIVKYKDWIGSSGGDKGVKILLTKTQIKKLEKYGFKKTIACYPDQYNFKEVVKDNEEFYNYGYDIVCNQNEPISFLLKNKIPFICSEHYDQFVIIYDGGDTFKRYTNFGQLALMHCLDDNSYINLRSKKEYKGFNIIEVVKVKDYLKN